MKCSALSKVRGLVSGQVKFDTALPPARHHCEAVLLAAPYRGDGQRHWFRASRNTAKTAQMHISSVSSFYMFYKISFGGILGCCIYDKTMQVVSLLSVTFLPGF